MGYMVSEVLGYGVHGFGGTRVHGFGGTRVWGTWFLTTLVSTVPLILDLEVIFSFVSGITY